MNRRVIVQKYKKVGDNKYFALTDDGEADFHAFGLDYEELDGVPGNYSTAIIERDDGTIEHVRVEHIRFIKG